jgi:phospholipase/carboxylesterase
MGRLTTPQSRSGRLSARPRPPQEEVGPGLYILGLDSERDALLSVPSRYRPERPAPLIVSFHGASGNAESGLYPLQSFADEAGLIILSPASRDVTWDAIASDYGPDVALIDRALFMAFARCAIDPGHLGIGGFSDGASYALSLGLTNGDLFTDILAFSPGFVRPASQHGSPRIFISHGIEDRVLPIDACSRRIEPRLERAGYDVTYHEFDGPHTVPPRIAREALDWFLQPDLAVPSN